MDALSEAASAASATQDNAETKAEQVGAKEAEPASAPDEASASGDASAAGEASGGLTPFRLFIYQVAETSLVMLAREDPALWRSGEWTAALASLVAPELRAVAQKLGEQQRRMQERPPRDRTARAPPTAPGT